jgi:quinoprotein glucose dehydrogenase
LGEYPELGKAGHRNTGTQLFGGCIFIVGGLVLIGASKDQKFRAIDKTTRKIIWEYRLPGNAIYV